MAFQPAPSCASVAAVAQLNGEQIVNRYVFYNASSWGSGELQALCVGFREIWVESLMPWLSYQYGNLVVEGRGLRVVGDVSFDDPGAGSATGGNVVDCEDNAQAACYKLSTGLVGRSFRGRTYIGGLSRSDIDNNRIVLATLAGINTVLNSLIGLGTVSSGWEMVVLSRFTGGAPRASAINSPVEAILSTSPIVASQRRRRPRRS